MSNGATVQRYHKHDPETVALLAMGPSIVDWLTETLTIELKPGFVDEIWTVNLCAHPFHFDVCFWMDDIKAEAAVKPGPFQLLKLRGKPVITSTAYPDILPNSYDYPIQEIANLSIELFGRPYLNNTVPMAVAYAMWKGVKALRLYGVDFTYPNRQYGEQGRGCTEAWLTAANQRGMEIQIAPLSTLMDTHGSAGIYGYRKQPVIVGPNGEQTGFVPAASVEAQHGSNDYRGAAPEAFHGLDGAGNPHPIDGDGQPIGNTEHRDNARRDGDGDGLQREPLRTGGGNGKSNQGHPGDGNGGGNPVHGWDGDGGPKVYR